MPPPVPGLTSTRPLSPQNNIRNGSKPPNQYFPVLWKSFAELRGINYNHTRGKALVPGKERQVLHDLLGNFRQRNPQVLIWWAMIESLALMAWGVGRTVLNALTYHGATVGSSTRDRLLSSIFDDDHNLQIRSCLAATAAIIFIIDNFQRGQQL